MLCDAGWEVAVVRGWDQEDQETEDQQGGTWGAAFNWSVSPARKKADTISEIIFPAWKSFQIPSGNLT